MKCTLKVHFHRSKHVSCYWCQILSTISEAHFTVDQMRSSPSWNKHLRPESLTYNGDEFIMILGA